MEALRKADIEVKVGVLSEEARRLNEVFVTFHEKRRPFFLMKSALSLDGKIATKIGESKWISNEESRTYSSRLRSVMDGIMVGINTVILDNPSSSSKRGEAEAISCEDRARFQAPHSIGLRPCEDGGRVQDHRIHPPRCPGGQGGPPGVPGGGSDPGRCGRERKGIPCRDCAKN